MASLIDQIEQSKENLQPLKQGRKTAILSERLQDTATSEREHWVQGRRAFEEKIMQYKGTDPLENWVEYIKWIQQSKLSGIGSDEVLGVFQRCTKEFLNVAQYKNDPRYCRIWIQYADLCQDPSDVFAFMKANGIAVGLALFWTSWSFVLDLRSKNYSRAWDVLEEGIRVKAGPIEKLRAALKTFQAKICEGIRANKIYPNFTFEDQENARKVLAEIDSTRRPVTSTSTQQHSFSGAIPSDPSAAKPKFSVFSDTAGHASGDVKGNWTVLPSEKERTKENLQKPLPMAGSVFVQSVDSQPKPSTMKVFEDSLATAPPVPFRGPAPQHIKGVLEVKKNISVQPDQPTKFIQESTVAGKVLEVAGYSRDLTKRGDEEISLEEARCINRYGIPSITTSASFEFVFNFGQEESQGQPICMYAEDDDDAMVLDLDSSSASVADPISTPSNISFSRIDTSIGKAPPMPTLSNDFSSVPVKKLGFTQAIYTPGSKSNKSNLSNKSEDNTTNSQPPFGLVMRPSSPTSTMNTSVAKCLMMGIAPSPTIQLKITDINTSGGSDTAASSERFTAFSSFLGSIQASPTIGTKSAVKALSSALARSPTAMIKAHGRRGSISVASRLSILPSPEKTAVIQAPAESKSFSSFSIFDDSKKTPVSSAQCAPFAVFCDNEPAVPARVVSSSFAIFEDEKPQSSGFAVFCDEQAAHPGASNENPAGGAVHKSSSFAIFCDEPEFQFQPSSTAAVSKSTAFSGALPVVASIAMPAAPFAVFCDEDGGDNTSNSTGNVPSAAATPQKDLNTSLASLHWSPLSCIAEESTMIDGRTSLLDGSMCKGIRSVGRSSRKRRFSGTDFASEDTEVLPSLVKCAEPYTEMERARLNRLVMGMLLKHPGMLGKAEVTFNQPFAFKAPKGKAKERLRAFDCQWDVLESLGKGGFGTVYKARSQNVSTQQWASACTSQEYAIKCISECNPWEFYISNALQNRLPLEQSDFFLRVAAVQLYRETSFLLCELVNGPSLHCIVNAFKTCGERLDETTSVWLLLQISEAISQMHSCGVIHGDIKTENILLGNLESLPLSISGETEFLRPSIKIIDFGSSVDAALYPSGTLFKGDAGTDTFGCEAAKNGLEWTVEPDLAGIAGTAHCLLFCEYMELAQKTTESGALKARPTRPFKRYWDVVFWERLFDLLINEEGTAQDVAALCLKNLSERKDAGARIEKGIAKIREIVARFSRMN